MHRSVCLVAVLLSAGACAEGMGAELVKETWDYSSSMQEVASRFRGTAGVVLHLGDSMTYANPYSQWARYGKGKTTEDAALLKWMHCGERSDRDGWHLASYDHPAGGRSHTAVSGIRVDEYLRGGKRGVPSLAQQIARYNPQAVILMLGTNDASAGRSVQAFQSDMRRAVDLILQNGTVVILSTIPPHFRRPDLAASYGQALTQIAKERKLPLIDLYNEILKRRPKDWNGTLLARNDVHLSARSGSVGSASAPTETNLRSCGYLLRGWLSVQKVAEVKRKVLDHVSPEPERAPPAKEQADWPPKGRPVKLPVTRDTMLSCVGREADCNLGSRNVLKTKSYQEMSLIDIDTAKLRGHVITGAMLYLHVASKDVQKRLTVSSIASEWVEGTSTGYNVQAGSSSFKFAAHPSRPWAHPGSDLTSVILGRGNTIWRFADTTEPDAQGWQTVAVDPLVIAARVAGLSYGFCVFDDTGSEWTRNGEQFEYRIFPNRFVHSREAGEKRAPYFTIWIGEKDAAAPGEVGPIRCDAIGLPPGEALVNWKTPPDSLGFSVRVAKGNRLDWATAQPVPRYLIPMAGEPGEPVELHLRDLSLDPRQQYVIGVRAVDAAGNTGPVSTAPLALSSHAASSIAGAEIPRSTEASALPQVGACAVAIVDPLDKVNPVTGEMIPSHPKSYLAANHLWSAKGKRVRLHAARNEFVAFQVVLQGDARDVNAQLQFRSPVLSSSLHRFRYVKAGAKDYLPDPLVPMGSAGGIQEIEGQRHLSLLADVYVPHDAEAGGHDGALTLTVGGASLTVSVELDVWNFTLPDVLSFVPEMNCYGLPAPPLEEQYYRLAHKHRTCLNRLPYSQSGTVHDGCAPRWNGRSLDWSEWDRRFTKYLDGSAFADLPRRSVPLDVFYLPLHENWPSSVFRNFNGSYWADEAFPERYRDDFVTASRQLAKHFREKKWNSTLFQCYLNNKISFKRGGWSRGSAPWILDEPSNFQDFWALRYFAIAFHEGVSQERGAAKVVFRADISRPQWQRDSLDGLLDVNVVGGAFRRYPRAVLDRKRQNQEIAFEYGSTNKVEASNVQAVGWCLSAWCAGLDGVLPWQTIGRSESWQKADQLSLFYPGQSVGASGPLPSVRLKAYRRGQQDVEYLVLLAQLLKQPRWAISESVKGLLSLTATTHQAYAEDAGIVRFDKLSPVDLWRLRTRVGSALSKAAPAPKRQLCTMDVPARDVTRLGSCYASPAPALRKTQKLAPVQMVTKTLQGRNLVQDAIIYFDKPDQNFASVARDNRLVRRDRSNAFLVKFDLRAAGVGRAMPIQKAFLDFYVWDPSSRGTSHVCAFRVTSSDWDEGAVTWQRPKARARWKGKDGFSVGEDTVGEPDGDTKVPPDKGRDTVNPPLRHSLDVTEVVKGWQSGQFPNYGIAIVAIVDRSVDDGQWTRFQVLGSEYARQQFTPALRISIASEGNATR